MPKAQLQAGLLVAYLALTALKPDPQNPRIHSKAQIRQIAESVRVFGFLVPVLIDRNRQIIAGHGRYEAAKLLKLAEIPTIQIEHLSPAQLRAFQLADNKLALNSEWSFELQQEAFKEIAKLDPSIDLTVTGYLPPEIDLIFGAGSSVLAHDPADENLEALAKPGPAVSRLGDVWIMGNHRLLCGDAREGASFVSLMSGRKADAVFSDPPYNVRVKGHVSGKGKVRHREFVAASGELSTAEFEDVFLEPVFRNLVEHSRDGSVHFHCIDHHHIDSILKVGNRFYRKRLNICAWIKLNAGMGSFYRSQHELIAVFRNGKTSHRNNIELGRHGRSRSNVWQYAGGNSFSGRNTDEGNLLKLHPTVKPVQLVADALLDCTARGDLVVDPFLGSGSTLIAAERTGRVCFGLEFDPLYVDVVVRRWQRHTGACAVHNVTGKRFDVLAKNRGIRHGK